jgi:hypothetical protein
LVPRPLNAYCVSHTTIGVIHGFSSGRYSGAPHGSRRSGQANLGQLRYYGLPHDLKRDLGRDELPAIWLSPTGTCAGVKSLTQWVGGTPLFMKKVTNGRRKWFRMGLCGRSQTVLPRGATRVNAQRLSWLARGTARRRFGVRADQRARPVFSLLQLPAFKQLCYPTYDYIVQRCRGGTVPSIDNKSNILGLIGEHVVLAGQSAVDKAVGVVTKRRSRERAATQRSPGHWHWICRSAVLVWIACWALISAAFLDAAQEPRTPKIVLVTPEVQRLGYPISIQISGLPAEDKGVRPEVNIGGAPADIVQVSFSATGEALVSAVVPKTMSDNDPHPVIFVSIEGSLLRYTGGFTVDQAQDSALLHIGTWGWVVIVLGLAGLIAAFATAFLRYRWLRYKFERTPLKEAQAVPDIAVVLCSRSMSPTRRLS